jgi:hypothetical protein
MNVNPAPMFNATPPSMIANSAYILASCHNSVNTVEPLDPGLQIVTVNGGPIIAGVPNALNISTGNPNLAVDGVMVYALNTNNQRVGSFSDTAAAPVFVDFDACGFSIQGQKAGVIQEMVVSDCVSILYS